LVALLLVACPAAKAASPGATSAPAEKIEYMVILLDGKKVGHAEMIRQESGDTVTTVSRMTMTIGREGVGLTVQQSETNVETRAGGPISFVSVEDFGLGSKKTVGVVKDGKIHVTVSASLGQTQAAEKTMDWPAGAVMSEAARLLSLESGLKEGTKYSMKLFMPSSLAAWDEDVVIGKRVKVDLLGRVVELTEAKSTVKAPGGAMVVTTYINDEGDALKMVTPALGVNVEMVSCSKAVALGKNDVVDFFDRLILASPAPLDKLSPTEGVSYTLAVTAKSDVKIPDTDNQRVAVAGDTITVTVKPVARAAGAAIPYQGDDPAAMAALKSGQYVQSDDPKIITLAKEAVGGAKDAATAAANIEKFVRAYITKKNLNVGYASASEVAVSKEGDCTEHAVLAAALCRAAGIPARLAVGLGYVRQAGDAKNPNGIFGPHAWVETFIAGKWVGLDAALNGFDAGHIALATGDGDPDQFFAITSSLGNFKIVKAEAQK
jgi:hypothetical protein